MHDNLIIVNCYTIDGTIFWFVPSFSPYLLNLFPNLYNYSVKSHTITHELAEIK